MIFKIRDKFQASNKNGNYLTAKNGNYLAATIEVPSTGRKLPRANKGATLEFRSCAIVSLTGRSCTSKKMACTHASLSIHGVL